MKPVYFKTCIICRGANNRLAHTNLHLVKQTLGHGMALKRHFKVEWEWSRDKVFTLKEGVMGEGKWA